MFQSVLESFMATWNRIRGWAWLVLPAALILGVLLALLIFPPSCGRDDIMAADVAALYQQECIDALRQEDGSIDRTQLAKCYNAYYLNLFSVSEEDLNVVDVINAQTPEVDQEIESGMTSPCPTDASATP